MSEELRRGIPQFEVVARVEFTEKEKARHMRESEQMLKEMGILKEDETLADMQSMRD